MADGNTAQGTVFSIRTIGLSDLWAALGKGFDDFRAKPSHLFFLALIYPIIGIVLASIVLDYQLWPLMFPLVSGFALVGPFAATGFYELSRRRELGLEATWTKSFMIFRSPAAVPMAVLAGFLLILFVTWMFSAEAIYTTLFPGRAPESFAAFFDMVFQTREGFWMVIVGCGVGFIFALICFAISVVSFPLLLDKENVSAATAIRTSLSAVRHNPFTMMVWALTIAVILAVAALPALVGLSVAVPVLGHASWHLYRRVVA